MKKILVTGAAGFIGFHLCKALIVEQKDVVGIDNFNPYYDPKLKEDRVSRLSCPVLRMDIRDKESLIRILREHEISHVVHLAAQAGVRMSLAQPEAYTSNNIEGFLSLLEACKQFPNIKIIYASSSSVYGKNEKIPFHETDSTDNPTSLYAVTKKTNELLAHAYHHLFGLSLIGLRYFTVYGPWGRPDMAYFSFTKKILSEEPIHLYNDGMMQRDFTYVDDIVAGTLSALDYPGKFEIFNLGSHHPVQIVEFVKILEKLLNKRAILEMHPHEKTEVLSTFADLTKSQKLLNYTPKTELELGLSNFVNWYVEYYSVPSFLSL